MKGGSGLVYRRLMPVTFADAAARQALRRAIEVVEATSAVEVVVAVRRQSSGWLHVNVIVGAVAGFAALALMLFGSHPFALASILFDPFVVGMLAGLLVELVPACKRVLTPARWRRRAVQAQAAVTFVGRNVHATSGRTGLLIYASWLERDATVVADVGVVASIAPADLDALRAGLAAAMKVDGAALARAVTAFAAAAARGLPRSADDINELPDEIDAHVGRRRRPTAEQP